MIRLKTEVLVEFYREGDIDFSNCLRNISQIGGLHYLDRCMLNRGIIDIKSDK